jgi:hypothetical protein
MISPLLVPMHLPHLPFPSRQLSACLEQHWWVWLDSANAGKRLIQSVFLSIFDYLSEYRGGGFDNSSKHQY